MPAVCVLCGRPGEGDRDLCSDCEVELPYISTSCRRCAIPVPADGLCGQCQQYPPSFDAATAVFHYAEPLDHLIQGLKFNSQLYNARLLGHLMAERLKIHNVNLPEVVVPVPLHPQRLRERGFNQALELARPIAKSLGIPLEKGLCRRIRATPAQTGLNARERRRNLKGAFEVRPLSGIKHVAIVDDVMTTASTAEVLAAALKQVGVEQVDVWVCARA